MEQRFKPTLARLQILKFNYYTIYLQVNFISELPGRIFQVIYILGDSWSPWTMAGKPNPHPKMNYIQPTKELIKAPVINTTSKTLCAPIILLTQAHLIGRLVIPLWSGSLPSVSPSMHPFAPSLLHVFLLCRC